MLPPDPVVPEQAPPAVDPAASVATQAPVNPLVPIPLTPEDLKFWRAEIERSRTQKNDVIAAWDSEGNLERYTPKSVKATGGTDRDAKVNVAKDFSDVERKIAALFYDTPKITLVPDPETDGAALPLQAEIINALLSDKRMHAMATIRPTIQDCLVAIQPVPTEIGYNSVSVNVDQPVLDPVSQQPVIDPMTGAPAMQQMPVIVWEEFFWKKISGKATLLPSMLKDTQYDAAPWEGFEFRWPASQAIKAFALPKDIKAADSESGGKPYFTPLGESNETGEPMIAGVKLWYRAHLRDDAVTHPEVIRELVLIEGRDEPAVHRNCPYQEIGTDGRLTPNSIIGYPMHPLALRDLTDSAYVAADCTITAPLTLELNKYRTQVVQKRDASKLHLLFDTSKVNPEVRQKIEDGDTPKMIPVEAGALDQGVERIVQQVPAVELGRENYEGQRIIEHDRAQVLGIDANQVGATSQNSKTATEITTAQRNTDARFEQERQRAVRWFLTGVQKLSALVLRYGDRVAVEILGQKRGQVWLQARDAGQFNRFSFEIVADSGNYIDIEARKRVDMQLYNMTAKDPSLNRGVVQARLATDFGLDPSQWIVTKPPEQKPEPPTLSISVKPEDLDPALPSYVGTYAILTAGGVKGLPPPTYVPPVMAPQAEHGGMAELTPRLNQHQMDESGAQSGPKVM